MADPERLRLTVTKQSGTDLRSVEVVADPEDGDGLNEHLKTIAREQDGRGSSSDWWAGEYTMRVDNLSREWVPPFTVRGRES